MSVVIHPQTGASSQNISSRIMEIPSTLFSWGKWVISWIPLVGRLVTVDQVASDNLVRLGADAQARKNQGALARWRDSQSNTAMADHIVRHSVPSDVTSGQREVSRELLERLDTMYSRRSQYSEISERIAKAHPEVVDLVLEGMNDDLALMKLGLHEFTPERRRELKTRCQTAEAFRVHLNGLKRTYPPQLVDSIAMTHFNASLQGIVPHADIQAELAYLLERTHLCDQFEEAWNQVQSLNLSEVQGNDTPLHRNTAGVFQAHLSHQRDFSQMMLVRERRAMLDVSHRDMQRRLAFYEKIRGYTSEELRALRDQLPENDFYRDEIEHLFSKQSKLEDSSTPIPLGTMIRRRIVELRTSIETLTQRVARLDVEILEKKKALLAKDADIRRSLFDLKVVYLLDTIKTIRALPHEYFEREMNGFHKCLRHADIVNSVKVSKLYGLPFPQRDVDAIEDAQVKMMLNTIKDMAPHLAAKVCVRILTPGEELHRMYEHLAHELQCVRAAGAEDMTPNAWKAKREAGALSSSERESFKMMSPKYSESLKNQPTWAAPARVPIDPATKVFSVVSGPELLKRGEGAKVVCIHLAKMSVSERREVHAELTKEKILSLLGDRDSIRLTYVPETRTFIEDPQGKIELMADYSKDFIPTVADLTVKSRSRIVEQDGRIVRGNKGKAKSWKFWLTKAREQLGHGIGISKARKRSYRADKHDLMNALRTLFDHISSGRTSELTTNDYLCLMEYIDRVLEGDLAHLFRDTPECRQYIEIYENIRSDLYKTLLYSDTNHLLEDVLGVEDSRVERESVSMKKEMARIRFFREVHTSVLMPWVNDIESFLSAHRNDPYVQKYYGRWIAALDQVLPELKALVAVFPREFQGNSVLSEREQLQLHARWLDEGGMHRDMIKILQEVQTRLPRIIHLSAGLCMPLKLADLNAAEERHLGSEDTNGVRGAFLMQIANRFFRSTDRIRMTLQGIAATHPQGELLTASLDGAMTALGQVYSWLNATAAIKRDLLRQGGSKAMVQYVYRPVSADTSILSPSS